METKKIRFHITVCGGMCHGRWVHSYQDYIDHLEFILKIKTLGA